MSDGLNFGSQEQKSTTASAASGAAQTGTQSNARTQRTATSSARGVAGLKSLLNTNNHAGTSSENLDKIFRAAERVLKNTGSDAIDGDLSIIKFDHRQIGGYLSAVLFTLKRKEKVACHALIIEGSDVLNPTQYNVGADRFRIETPAGQVFGEDSKLYGKVVTANMTGVSFINAGATVLPVEACKGLEDELVNSSVFSTLIFQAKNAVIVNLARELDDTSMEFNIAKLIDAVDGVNLEIDIDFRPTMVTDAVGLPLRSDVSITVSAVDQNQNSQTALRDDRLDLVTTHAMIELDYISEEDLKDNFGLPQSAELTQRYLPRLIISANKSAGLTIENHQTFFLGLYNLTKLASDNRYLGGFLPQFETKTRIGNEEIDIREFGAVGYECTHLEETGGSPAMIQWHDGQGSIAANLAEFANDVIYSEGISFSVDVDSTAPNGWITDAYLAEAQGNTRAHEVISEQLNILTDGVFGALDEQYRRDHGQYNYFIDEQVLIPRGEVYTNGSSALDTRTLGNLAALNYWGPDGNIDQLIEYSRLFTNNEESQLYRLDRMTEILKNIYGANNVVVKGWWSRISVNAITLELLERALEECGYNPVTATPSQFTRVSNRRTSRSIGNTVYKAQNGLSVSGVRGGRGGQYRRVSRYN